MVLSFAHSVLTIFTAFVSQIALLLLLFEFAAYNGSELPSLSGLRMRIEPSRIRVAAVPAVPDVPESWALVFTCRVSSQRSSVCVQCTV